MQICHWYTPADEPDARIMIPGCMTRVDDPDQCTCEVTADEVIRLRAELEKSKRAYAVLATDSRALVAAVGEHPDRRAIFARSDEISASQNAAYDLAGRRPR